MRTYDDWKTDCDEEKIKISHCDCCGRIRALRRVELFGIETYGCHECLGEDPDAARERLLDDKRGRDWDA